MTDNFLTQGLSGILLHPTSLPGPEMVGTLGDEAYRTLDWLKLAGQKIWQILPLGPTGYGDSPYSSFSAFAGNPYLISLAELVKAGDLLKTDLPKPGENDRVDYGRLYHEKLPVLELAAKNFFARARTQPARWADYQEFRAREDSWLDDYAIFMTLKKREGGGSWQAWPDALRLRADRDFEKSLRSSFDYQAITYCQWQFDLQWKALRLYAKSLGIKILGDAPIFVAPDSADVWSRQDLFQLTEDGRPLGIAGVPPDYFSATGQLWGNPLYDWDALKNEDYAWWKARLTRLTNQVDLIRIDHFRGFAGYWRVPADAKTAETGEWVDGPGADFFDSLVAEFGQALPLVAEDLGIITPDVVKLRDDFSLPGMRIFCFAPWGESEWEDQDGTLRPFSEHPYLPENWDSASVAYPGTHDNETFVGWLSSLTPAQTRHFAEYLGIELQDRLVQGFAEAARQAMLRLLLKSSAGTVVFSIQDILGLGKEARLNLPGSCDGNNWTWRLRRFLPQELASDLSKLVKEAGR